MQCEAEGYNDSIYLMIAVPYSLFAVVGFFVYRGIRRKRWPNGRPPDRRGALRRWRDSIPRPAWTAGADARSESRRPFAVLVRCQRQRKHSFLADAVRLGDAADLSELAHVCVQ